MPSLSLQTWSARRIVELDGIESALRSLGAPRRQIATQQVVRAYALLLTAQFQGFCRDLHSECIDQMIHGITPPMLYAIVQDEFLWNRKLDLGNPNAGNIGTDFGRLGISF